MNKRGALLVISSACFVATQAIFAKLAYSVGVTVMTALFLRFAFGTVALFFCLLSTHQNIKFPKAHHKLLFLLIFTHVILDIFLFEAFYLLPASLAIMFYYAYPAFTGIMAYLIWGNKLSPNKLMALFLSAIGLIMLLSVTWNKVNLIGVLFAVTAAFLYAGYLVYLPKLLNHFSKLSFSYWLFLISAAVYFLMGLISGNLDFKFSFAGWIYLACISLISSVAATITLFYGLPLIGPTQSAIILTIEPPITAILGYIIFKETYTASQMIGALFILMAVLVSQFSFKRLWEVIIDSFKVVRKIFVNCK